MSKYHHAHGSAPANGAELANRVKSAGYSPKQMETLALTLDILSVCSPDKAAEFAILWPGAPNYVTGGRRIARWASTLDPYQLQESAKLVRAYARLSATGHSTASVAAGLY